MRRNDFSIADVRQFWDVVATVYDHANAQVNWTHTERFSTMQKFLPKRASLKILNVWSRTGGAIPYIRELCPDADIMNLEASLEMIAIAKRKNPGEIFEETDLHDLPCETESKDVVVSLETLEHVPDPLHFLLECHRVLRVGGRLILSCPPTWTEWPLRLYEQFFHNHGEGPHRFPTVAEVLRTLRNCSFTVVHHRGTICMPVGPAWFKKAIENGYLSTLRHIGWNRLTFRHFFIAEKTESRDPVWAKIHEEIIRPGLSMHSGTCVGLSRGTLRLRDYDGDCLPEPTGTGAVPEICYACSPEVHASYPEMNAHVFGRVALRSTLLGEYRRTAIAHVTDAAVRRNAASGGVLTGTLLHLLETGKITGAVVLHMDPQHPWRAIPSIARTREEILASAQSKYVVSPVNTILEILGREEGPLAYVGLPHQVFAIRRLQQIKHPSVAPITFILGPFFGNELHGSAVQSFLRKFGASVRDVASLSYRAGEWPGNMEARLKDGRVVRMPKFHANYLIPFHITKSSLLSHDLTNEFTDLSGGDAWAPVYEERGKGFSLLITRTEQGDAIIREMEAAGKIWLQDISEEEAVHMQSHGLDFKKRGSLLRMEFRRRKGLRTIQYGLPLPKVGWKRRCFERVLGCIFWVCSFQLSRWLIDHAPEWIIGPIFQKTRTLWKKMTYNVKRKYLQGTNVPR